MKETLKKMRFLFFIPVWGVVIHVFYFYFKLENSYQKKKLYNYLFLFGLTYTIGVITVAFIMRLIDVFINIDEFFSDYGTYVAQAIAGYLINIPCLIYIRKYVLFI